MPPRSSQSLPRMAVVERRHGDLKAAVRVHEGGVGAVVLDVLVADEEVRDFGAVFGGGLELFDDEVGGVELGRERFADLQIG